MTYLKKKKKTLLFLCTVNDPELQTSSVRKADNFCILSSLTFPFLYYVFHFGFIKNNCINISTGPEDQDLKERQEGREMEAGRKSHQGSEHCKYMTSSLELLKNALHLCQHVWPLWLSVPQSQPIDKTQAHLESRVFCWREQEKNLGEKVGIWGWHGCKLCRPIEHLQPCSLWKILPEMRKWNNSIILSSCFMERLPLKKNKSLS